MKYLFTVLVIGMNLYNVHAQSNWSLQTTAGVATETNLGDTGLRLSTKISRQLGKSWNAFAQIGTFQMFQSNDEQSGDNAYLKKRSLSTTNIDLGGSFFLLNKTRIQLGVFAAGSYRVGRQLWPEFAVNLVDHRDIYYTHEKISEGGYALGVDFGVRVSKQFWLGLDAHCHSYNYFGEYLGIGLNARVDF